MAKLQGRGNENRGNFSKAQIDLAIQLRNGLGGVSPSGNACWNLTEIARHKDMRVNGKAVHRSTIDRIVKRNTERCVAPALQKRDVKSIRLAEGELMTDAIGDLLGELLTRDFNGVKTEKLPEMISTLVNTRKNIETKSLEEIDAAAVLQVLAKKHAISAKKHAISAKKHASAAGQIIDMKEDNDGNFTQTNAE